MKHLIKNSSFVPPADRYVRMSFAVALLSGLGLSPSLGFAVPIPAAGSSVFVNCTAPPGRAIEDDAAGLSTYSLSCDKVSTLGSAAADVSTDFGPGYPLIGNVAASAEATRGEGPYTISATTYGRVTYFFTAEQIAVAPGLPPLVLPTIFTARGQGDVTTTYGSNASARGYVYLGIDGGSTIAFVDFNANSADTSDEFDETRYFDLVLDQLYSVSLFASCAAGASIDGTSASCQAVVDPFIGFDQAAFDALMGPDTFRLDDYYRFVFSANVTTPPEPMPLPSTILLLGAGLLGLGVAKRHQPRKIQ